MLVDTSYSSPFRKQIKRLQNKLKPAGPSAASAPFMEFIKHSYFTHFTPKFPQIIQVQTQYGCNARCVFCPMGSEDNQLIGRMEDAIFERIVDEAVSNNVKVFSPYLQNDPLVDRKIHERIAVIRERRGKKFWPKTKLITNGGLLTEEKCYNLIKAGLEYIVFSVHGIEKTIYDNIMQGPKFETTIRNIERFVQIKDELRSDNPQIEVWAVKTREVEVQLQETREFWASRNIKFKARQLDNRANPDIVDLTDMAPENAEWKYAYYCTIPFWRAWVLWNGDMVLCCVDWERRMVFGNINKQSIKEIWNGEAYKRYRRRMMKRDLIGTLCEHCQGT